MFGSTIPENPYSEMILNARVLLELLMYHCFKAHKSKEKTALMSRCFINGPI